MNLLDLARSAVADLPAGNTPATLTRFVPPPIRAELERLIAIVLADDSDADRAEALTVALADPDAALISFRTLAGELVRRPADDRRCCSDCANLTREGQCKAALRGDNLGFGHAKTFRPLRNQLLRCRGFQPLPSDADQRPAGERWPGIAQHKP